MHSSVGGFLCSLLLFGLVANGAAATPTKTIPLWPGTAPGDTNALGLELDVTKPGDNPVGGKPLIRLANVAQPTLSVFRPKKSKDIGTAVMVCPGGGYNILAMDLEGTEVCAWLNSMGVTALLLKYRVPKRPGRERHAAPLQDAQRAFSLARHQARELGFDPQRLGVMGFSAGAHLSATFSATRERTYSVVDAADEVGLRPAFVALIYPAYLTTKERGDAPSAEIPVTTNFPPAFITITQDDPVRMENAVHFALALQQVKVPVELHLYPSGGHGYGLRRTEQPVTSWPDRMSDWMRARGWLTKGASVR